MFTLFYFSVHSGDSELIGVEDNPEFDYPAQNVSKMLYRSNQKFLVSDKTN